MSQAADLPSALNLPSRVTTPLPFRKPCPQGRENLHKADGTSPRKLPLQIAHANGPKPPLPEEALLWVKPLD
ncbi:hypothetical protein I3760_01G028900 [Carya illinoinensis]|nr:hypothetical protein I3760_01G028900 [Carya illinoinensis]